MTTYRSITDTITATEARGEESVKLRVPLEVGRLVPFKDLLFFATKTSRAEYRILAESGGLIERSYLLEVKGSGRQVGSFLRILVANLQD